MHLEEFCILFNFTGVWWTNSEFQPEQALTAVKALMAAAGHRVWAMLRVTRVTLHTKAAQTPCVASLGSAGTGCSPGQLSFCWSELIYLWFIWEQCLSMSSRKSRMLIHEGRDFPHRAQGAEGGQNFCWCSVPKGDREFAKAISYRT